jgi:transposase
MEAGHRPRIPPDYGRGQSLWSFGAFEPQTGLAYTECTARRRSVEFTAFLHGVTKVWPTGELILILDNLSIHRSLETRLWALAHPHVRFLFQPTYTPWLNLIEPWWKQLRSLALLGRRFECIDEVAVAIAEATAYWNQERHPYHWRKKYSRH